jgi:hypothetical protein
LTDGRLRVKKIKGVELAIDARSIVHRQMRFSNNQIKGALIVLGLIIIVGLARLYSGAF